MTDKEILERMGRDIMALTKERDKYKADADRLAEALKWYVAVSRCADPIKKQLPNPQGYASNVECLPCGVCHHCTTSAALAAHERGEGNV